METLDKHPELEAAFLEGLAQSIMNGDVRIIGKRTIVQCDQIGSAHIYEEYKSKYADSDFDSPRRLVLSSRQDRSGAGLISSGFGYSIPLSEIEVEVPEQPEADS